MTDVPPVPVAAPGPPGCTAAGLPVIGQWLRQVFAVHADPPDLWTDLLARIDRADQ